MHIMALKVDVIYDTIGCKDYNLVTSQTTSYNTHDLLQTHIYIQRNHNYESQKK